MKSFFAFEKLLTTVFYKIYKLKSNYFFIIVSLIALFPFLIISFFNNPASDDFVLSYESQTEPFLTLIIRRYFFWSGRYISNMLFCLNPLVIDNYFLFKIIPIAFILIFIFALYLFISSLELNVSELEKYSYVGFIFFLYVYQMPSVSEGFYWVTALYVYLVSQILILFFFSLFFQYLKTRKSIYFFLSSLFLFATIGTNEITVVSLLFIIFVLFSYDILVNVQFNKILFFIFIFTIGFAFLEAFAPGNFKRAELNTVKYQFIKSIVKSFQISISLIMKWIPIITICCLFLISNINKLLKERINTSYIIHPFLSFLMFFILIFISVFTCFYITTNVPGRVLNMIYFFFIFGYLYFVFTLVHYFSIIKECDLNYPSNIKICLGVIILLISFSNNNITMAYHDLITGKAYKYNNEMKKRFELIKKSKKNECVLPALVNLPLTIYSRDVMGLTTDKNNWKNLEIARYYRKESILIRPVDSLTE
jgi:hypothetical protein